MNPKFVLIISVLILFLKVSGAEAQEFKSVSGVITAFQTIPLNNVKVSSQKSKEVVYTDTTGIFKIKSTNKDILTISASGFVNRKFKVHEDNFYKIGVDYIDNVTNFNEAVSHGHISEDLLRKGIFSVIEKTRKDYSKYKSIYELIASEFYNLRVNGTTVNNTKRRSMGGSLQVLYVVNDRIVPDLSFVLPDDILKIEFIDDVGATLYGMSGANGVIKITLK